MCWGCEALVLAIQALWAGGNRTRSTPSCILVPKKWLTKSSPSASAQFSPAVDPAASPRDQLAHPAGGAHCAAEAVEMHADDVARRAAARVARQGNHLLVRVGVRDELGDAGAEVAQRAQRGADAAALRVAQQRRRVGRARDADKIGRASCR